MTLVVKVLEIFSNTIVVAVEVKAIKEQIKASNSSFG